MIPLGDADRRPVRFPIITAVIIGINALVFILELVKGRDFIFQWALIPSEIVSGRNLITILTAMFMHISVLHIAGNMIYLWAFGPEMEDVMGRFRYPIFYLSGGLIAFVVQVVVNPDSTIPTLGASGAIAAVMGAFLITFPHDRIRTLLIIFFFVTVSLIPAIFLIGFWFFIQLISEADALVERQAGGIAYIAHIAGFIFGVVSARLFEYRKKQVQKED